MSHAIDKGSTTLDADHREWIEKLARVGYGAHGVVYIIIGVLALQVAFGNGGETTGPGGALGAIARQPFGQVLLIVIGIGLAGYSIWRFVQAGLDPEHKGTDAKGLAARAGYVCSGIIYASLSFEAIRMVIGGGGGQGSDGSTEHWTGWLMSQPYGRYLVGAAGLAILGTAIFQFYKSAKADFQRMLKFHEMSTAERVWSERIGRFGYASRGVVYLLIGGGLLMAAFRTQPSEAMGIGQALSYLAEQSYGPWLLGLVAFGLAAYGLFSAAILSRYRSILHN